MLLHNDDCFNILPHIEDKSVQLILTDPPYNTTKNKWDIAVPLDKLWEQYKRIIKYNGAIVMFSQTPFDKILGASNLEMLKYEIIWQKESPTGIYNCNFAPMKLHENILVFSKAAACYVKDKSRAMKYNPQKTTGTPYINKHGGVRGSNYDQNWENDVTTVNNGDRFPVSILKYSRDRGGYHPTLKPVALLENLIKQYTDSGDLVVDTFMGSGSTGVAAKNTNRDFIGIEMDTKYFEIARERIYGNV